MGSCGTGFVFESIVLQKSFFCPYVNIEFVVRLNTQLLVEQFVKIRNGSINFACWPEKRFF